MSECQFFVSIGRMSEFTFSCFFRPHFSSGSKRVTTGNTMVLSVFMPLGLGLPVPILPFKDHPRRYHENVQKKIPPDIQ